jgi:hypothetical protein
MAYGILGIRNFQLSVYSDVDWANCVDERKSTSGGAFFLGDSLVSWLRKKQGSISLSTTEAEYIAACHLLYPSIVDDSDTCRLGGKIYCTDPNSL